MQRIRRKKSNKFQKGFAKDNALDISQGFLEYLGEETQKKYIQQIHVKNLEILGIQ